MSNKSHKKNSQNSVKHLRLEYEYTLYIKNVTLYSSYVSSHKDWLLQFQQGFMLYHIYSKISFYETVGGRLAMVKGHM